MKTRPTLICVLFACVGAVFPSAGAAAATEWKVVETIHYAWLPGAAAYTFVLRVPVGYDSDGGYTQLQIRQSDKLLLEVMDEDGLETIVDSLKSSRSEPRIRDNVLRSRHLLMLRDVHGKGQPPALFLFGRAFASDPGSLHVIELDKNGKPYEALHLSHLDVDGFEDVGRDGTPELIGWECLVEDDGQQVGYQPFSLYRFGTPGSPMKFDLALSRKYTLAHYYGWAGPGCRNDVIVVLHPPGGGKPEIMNAQKAKSLR